MMTADRTMRAPCPRCGECLGRIETRNGQDCVFCQKCGKFCYNAPRAETGREVRSLSTRADVPPGKRSRVLLRDNFRCFSCGRGPQDDVVIEVGHLLSVEAGRLEGLTDTEINSEENLAAQCQECNSGLSSAPVPLRLLIAVLRARLTRSAPDGELF